MQGEMRLDRHNLLLCEALMGTPRSPGVRIVIPKNRWDNFGGNLQGEVGLHERLASCALTFTNHLMEKNDAI